MNRKEIENFLKDNLQVKISVDHRKTSREEVVVKASLLMNGKEISISEDKILLSKSKLNPKKRPIGFDKPRDDGNAV